MRQEKAKAVRTESFARGRRGNFDNRREEVLQAAADVFSDRGFRNATLEDVARVLNITRPALYHYARNKDELAEQCMERGMIEIRDAIAAAGRQKTGREQLVAFLRRYAEIACNGFGRCFILVNYREYGQEEQEAIRAGQREISLAVRDMLTRGAEDGSLLATDPAVTARALFGAFNGIPIWFRPQAGATPGQIADEFLAIFLNGLTP